MILGVLLTISYFIGVYVTYNVNLETLKGHRDYYFRKAYFLTPSFIRVVLAVVPIYILYARVPNIVLFINIFGNEGLDYLRLEKRFKIFIIEFLQIMILLSSAYLCVHFYE